MKRRDFLKGLAVAPAIAFLGLPKPSVPAIPVEPVYMAICHSDRAEDILKFEAPDVGKTPFVEWKNWNAGRVLNDEWVGRFKGARVKRK